MDEDDEKQTTDKPQCGSGSTSVDEDSQELTAPISVTRVPGSGCGLLSVRNKHTLLALPLENRQAKTSSRLTQFQSHRGRVPRPYHHTVHVFPATTGRAPLCTASSFDAPGCRAASDSAAPRGGPVVTGRAAVSRQMVSPQLELQPAEDEKRVEEEEEVELFQSMLEETRRGDRRWADLRDDADYATDSDNNNTADRAGCRGPDLASAAAQPYVAQIHDPVALRAAGKVNADHPGPLPVSDGDAVKASERSHVTPSGQQTRHDCQQGNGGGAAASPASMSFQTQQSDLPTLQQRIPGVQEQRQSLQQQEWSNSGPRDGNSDPSHPLGRRRPGSPLTGVNSRPKRQRREPAALSSDVSSAWRIHRTRSTEKQKATVSVESLELTNGSGHSLGHQCMMPAPAPAFLPAVGRGARNHRAPGPVGMVGGNGGPIIRSDHRGGPAGLLLRDRGPIRAQSNGWALPRRKTHGSNDSSRLGSVRSCPRPQRYRRMSDLLLLPEVKLPAPKHSSSSDDGESGGEENEDICTDPVDDAALAGATATYGASAVAEVQELVTGTSAAESASPAARSMHDASAVARELAAMRTLRQRIHTAVVLKGSNQVKVSIPSARVLFPEILPKVCSRAGKAVELYLAVPRPPMRAQSQALHMGTGADANSDAGVGALRLERLAGVSLYGGGVAWALTGLRGMVSALGLSNGQKARLITVPGSRHQQDGDNGADGVWFQDLPGVIVSRMDDGTGTSRAKEKPLWANNYNGLLTVPATVTERLFPEVVASGREATLPIQAFASLPAKSELRAFPGVCLRGLFRRVVLAGLKAALMQLGVQEGEEVALWRHADGRMVLSRREDAPPLWPPGPTVEAVAAEDERVDVRRGTARAAALQLGCGRNRPRGRDRGRARGKDDSDEGKGLLDDASQAVAAEERAPADTARQRDTRRHVTPEFGNLEAAISIADPGQAYAKCWRDEVAPARGSDDEDNDSGSELGEEQQVWHQPHCQPGSQRLGGPLQRRPHGAIRAAQTAALAWDTIIGGSRSSSVPKTAVTLVAARPSRPAATELGQAGATATDFHKASMRLRQAEGAALKPLQGLGLVADNDHTQEADGSATDIPLDRLVYLDGRHRDETFKCVTADVHRNRGARPGPGLDPGCRITALELDLSKGATCVDPYNRGHRNHQQGDYVDGYEERKDKDMDIEDSIPGKRIQRRGYMSGAPCGTVNGLRKGEGLVGGTVPCYTSVPSLPEGVSLHGAAPVVVVNCIGPTAAAAAVTAAHSGVAPLQAVRMVRLSRGRPTQGNDARASNTQRPAAPQLPILSSLQKRRLVSPHVFPCESVAGAEISFVAAERQLQSMGAYNKSNPDSRPRTSTTVQSIRVVTGSARTSTRDTYGEEEHQLPAQAAVTCAVNSPPAGSGMVMALRAPPARGGSGTVPHPSQQPPPRWVAVQVPIVEMQRGLPSGGILAGRVVGENPPPLGPPPQVQIRSGMSMSSPSYAAAQYGRYGEGNLAATGRIKTPLVHLRRQSAAVPWLAPEAAAAATTLGCLASEKELVTLRPTRAGAIHASACALEEPAGALALCSLLFPANGGALWWG